jgi:FkbM family methyltransferase
VTMAHGDRPLLLPNGQSVHGASRADARFHQFIGDYFRPEVDIRPGVTVVDIGANIGMFSLEVLRRCHGDAHILAFEPAPETFAFLTRNVQELYPGADVRLARCALSDHEGDGTLYYRPRTAATASLYPDPLSGPDPSPLIDGFLRDPPPEYAGTLSRSVRRLPRAPLRKLLEVSGRWSNAKVVTTPCSTTTISAVLREHALEVVDFLKVDVEGSELDVLRGVSSEHWPMIRRLAMEVHDIAGRVETIRALLAENGFEQIIVEQEWPFEGTDIYMLHAARTAAPQ